MRKASVRMLTFVALLLLVGINSAFGQDIVVSSATPSSAEQGTVNLDVTISGSGFKRGAISRFFVTGTSDSGGIRVNSTRYVNQSKLVANVDVSDTALAAKFDVEVEAAGRTGKGIEKFEVLLKGQAACSSLLTLPERFAHLGTLNTIQAGVPRFTEWFGQSMRGRLATLGGVPVAVVAVGRQARLEVFFLDPANGNVLDGSFIGSSSAIQPHLSIDLPLSPYYLVMGETNSDGLPDLVIHEPGNATLFLRSDRQPNGSMVYVGPTVLPTAGFPKGLALADLDGDSVDELALAVAGQTVRKTTTPGVVNLYKFNGTSFSLWKNVTDPAPLSNFGSSIAVGDVNGLGSPDLVVGDPANKGKVYVFKGEDGFDNTPDVTLSGSVTDERLGFRLATGHFINPAGPMDILATSSFAGADAKAIIYSNVGSPSQYSTRLDPKPPYSGGWLTTTDTGSISGGSTSDILIGAVNASPNTSCNSSGVAYVFLTEPPPMQRYLLQAPPPADPDFAAYSWDIAAIDGTRLFLVGEKGRNLGGVDSAGQVYVYRVTTPSAP